MPTDRQKLVSRVKAELGGETSKAAAERAVEAVLNAIGQGIKVDKKVQLIGFGTFEVKKRSARMGRNPQTGKPMKIKASKTIKFKAGAGLKGFLNR